MARNLYCNCNHNIHSHGGLVLPDGHEPTYCTVAGCECDALSPIKLTPEELCRLSQIFNANPSVNLLQMTDARINEWLKTAIEEAYT